MSTEPKGSNAKEGTEMTRTNYGNGYKFKAIMARRSHKTTVTVQRRKNNGEWGKPMETQVFGNETPEQVVERLTKLNNREFRLA